jgi:hypothetical protein
MKEKNLKEDKIKISKMIMKSIKKEEMILETTEEMMIVNSKKLELNLLIEVSQKISLARVFMIKIDFTEKAENRAQYLIQDVLKENLSQDFLKEEVIKSFSKVVAKEEAINL